MTKLLEPIEKEWDSDNDDDKKQYDDMIDDCSGVIEICGMKYRASRILEELDPTAYSCGFDDWADGMPKRFECPVCGTVHKDEDSDKAEESAKECCQTEE